MPLSAGTQLGAFEIIGPLGAGGMGEVYRARDSRLDRAVAIKVLPEFVSSADPERSRRFEQEARAAAALNHPNILAVYQMGSYEGVPYLVSELLEGETLRDALRRGPLPLRKTIDYAVQIAHGLAAAHNQAIVHRDLKPENLFITREGRVKILDFGLAKLVKPKEPVTEPGATVLLETEPGIVRGTVGYMSPEQVRAQAADHRSDIFAFGAVLHEMLTGRWTFQKPTSADTISAILHEEPEAISEVAPGTPAALQRIVHRCLEKKPERRFQSASDLAFALESLSGPTTSPPGAGEEKTQPKRARVRPAAVALPIVLVAAVLGYFVTRTAPAPRVANYVQLTHDGRQKSLIGTDGLRLYLSLGSSGTSASQGIAAMSISGGEWTKLSIAPSPDMVPVDLSPDGSELLVVDGQGAPPRGPLWSLPILGGSPRRVGDAVAETAAWSPDGKLLAYSNWNTLFLAKADGTEARKLLAAKGDIKNIMFSPDGARLRFDTSESAGGFGQQLAWEASVDGRDLRRFLGGLHNPADECCGKWTADGKYFVFQSNRQIWTVAENTGFLHPRPKPVQLTSSPLALSSPLPGKNGKKLFVTGQTYRGELTRYDARSGQFSPFLGGISAEYVSFSNDGRRAAYVSYPDGALWRSNVDGSERLQLTFPPLYAMLPRWSPDGRQIVFCEFESTSGKPAGMYEVSSDGGILRKLAPEHPREQKDPNWSPDGSKIVFGGEANDSGAEILILDPSTGRFSILPGSQGLFSPRWSPDGRYIAVCSSDSMRVRLFDFQTRKWTELGRGPLGWLNWSRDGQYVYFLDYRGKGAVRRIRVSDQRSELVVDLKDFITTGRYGGSLSLAPDDSLLLLRNTGTQDIYALDWEAP